MGNCHSGGASGSQLLAATACGDTQAARQVLEQTPSAACYSTYVDRNSPLLVAAGRGHYRLVQAIVEAAVMAQGPARAKQRCINHTNHKGHSALILACMNGHAQCVEALVCNGASPLVLDNSRHNTALHWAASACRSECVQRLLGSSATFQMQSGEVVPIADIPCFDEDNVTLVKFVDRHNGWGMTALHLATFKGSSSTVRSLARNGASLGAVTVAPSVGANSPANLPVGSTALHLAAANEDLPVVRVILEAQASQGASDLRRAANSQGQRPLDIVRAASSSNMLLLHMLDPNQPMAAAVAAAPYQGLALYPGLMGGMYNLSALSGLAPGPNGNLVPAWLLARSGSLPGFGVRGSSRRSGANRTDQPPHIVLGLMLQRLRLVLSLEAVDLQNKLAAATAVINSSSSGGGSVAATVESKQQQQRREEKRKQLQTDQGQHWQQHQGLQTPAAAAAALEIDAGYDSCASAAATDDGDTIPSAADVPVPAVALCGSSTDEQYALTDGEGSDLAEVADADLARSREAHRSRYISQQKQKQALQAQQEQQQQEDRQRQRQLAAEVAALRGRLQTVQGLLATIQEMLAVLPASASKPNAGSRSGAGSGSRVAAASSAQQQNGGSRSGRRRRNSGGSSSSSSGRGRGWSLLGRVANMQRSGASSSSDPGGGRGLGSSSQAGLSDAAEAAAAAGTSMEDEAAEQAFTAFITPGTLASLAAVTKLLVNASALSGKQQQQQQGTFGTGAAAAATAAGSSRTGSAVSGPAAGPANGSNPARIRSATTSWLPVLAAADGTAEGAATTAAAALHPAAAVDARWAEQEHALMLMKSILQSASASLRASQQAASIAASRIALRQRQQEQLAALLASDSRIAALPGRRLAGHDATRVQFGSGSSSRRNRERSRDRDRDVHTLSSSSASRRERLAGSPARPGSGIHTSQLLEGLQVQQGDRIWDSTAGGGSSTAAAIGAAGTGSSSANGGLGSSLTWSTGMGLGLGLSMTHHLQHRALHTAATAAAAGGGGVLDSLSGGALGVGGSGRSSRRHHHERHYHGSRRSGRRQRGTLLTLPDPLAHTAGPAGSSAAGDNSHNSSSTSRRHRRHRHRQLDDSGTLLFLNPAVPVGFSEQRQAGSTAAGAAQHQQQQQQQVQDTLSQGGRASGSVLDAVSDAGPASASGNATAAAAQLAGGSAGNQAGAQPEQQQLRLRSVPWRMSSDNSSSSVLSLGTGGGYEHSSSSSGSSGDDSSAGSGRPDSGAAGNAHRPDSLTRGPDSQAGPDRPGGPAAAPPADMHAQAASGLDEIHGAGSDSEDGTAGAACTAPSTCSSLDGSTCAICMDGRAALSVSSCSHSLCLQCAYQLCCKAKALPLCPFCRSPIGGFQASLDSAAA